MPVFVAAHAAAPQIHMVIFRYGLVRAGVAFVLLAHTCRHQKAAAAPRESEYGCGVSGPSTADKILKMRKSYGAFKSADDLRAIKGIGPKRT